MILAAPTDGGSAITDNWRYPPSNGTLSLLKITLIHIPKLSGADGIQADAAILASETNQIMESADQGQLEQSEETVLIYIDNMPLTQSQLIYAGIIIMITAILLVTSVLTIIVIISNEHLRDVTGYYLISLAASDLLTALLITPLSIYAVLDPQWRFGIPPPAKNSGEDGEPLPTVAPTWNKGNSWTCKTEAYIGVMIWSTVVYTFMWVGVDRFAALNKPSRYDSEQTYTRCKCWIMFTWVTSILLSCPILAAQMEAKYYPEAFLCVLDWGATKAYSATLATLVILPSLISICYTYNFIFSSMRDPSDLEDTQKMMLETDPTYMMSFFVILAFGLSWAPWFALRAYETIFQDDVKVKALHFSLMWLALAGGCWKLLIYTITNREFRRGLVTTLGYICCGCCIRKRSSDSRERSEYEVIAARNRFQS